jgi:putative hydrolase of the HAD superfamily
MGIQMGLISNWDLSLQSVIEGLDMGHYFSSIISSAAVRMHKPQQGIFELALRQTGTTAVEALHVGDHLYADVQGARLAGIKPVFIDREGIGHSGDFLSIRSLDQLVDIVQD